MDRRHFTLGLTAVLGAGVHRPAAAQPPAAQPPAAQPPAAQPAAQPAPKPAATARPLRLLAFGDSLTAGFGLPEGQGFVPRLEAWLQANGAPTVRLINAGLSGDTSYGGRVRIGWALRTQPDAVLVELGANDMLLRMAPDRTARNLDAIIRAAAEGGRPVALLGIHATGDRAFRAQWDAMWPQVAARHAIPLVPDLYAGIRAVPVPDRPAYLQADRLHASPKGVATMVALAGPVALGLLRAAAARRAA